MPPATYDGLKTRQGLNGLGLTLPEKDLSFPNLIPDAILDGWDQSSVSMKSKYLGRLFPRCEYFRYSSKQPKFRLAIDPPEGDELEEWKVLRRRVD